MILSGRPSQQAAGAASLPKAHQGQGPASKIPLPKAVAAGEAALERAHVNSNPIEAPFRKAVETMLNRAASSLKRGPCTCLHCRGSGAVECAQCKGAGVLNAAADVRAHAARDLLLGLRTAVGLAPRDVPYGGSKWMQTNRCPRCRGHGHLVCDLCSGTGKRYPYLAQDHWRQCAGQPGAAPCTGPDCPIE